MSELFSKSQLQFAIPLARAARKKSLKTAAKVKKTDANDWHREMLNRVLNEADKVTIRDLHSKEWTTAAIACGLELKRKTVSKFLSAESAFVVPTADVKQ